MTVAQALKVAQLAGEYTTTYNQMLNAREDGNTRAEEARHDDLSDIADEVARVGGIDRSDAGRELYQLAKESVS